MPGYVYLLEDERGMFYVGRSMDPAARFKRHLGGFVHTTQRMKNPKVSLVQEYPTIEIAKKVELKLKKFQRKDYLGKIVKEGYIKMKI